MTDDNNSRYRSGDGFSSAPAGQGAQAANDPLAELARLIGKNDPFSEFGRSSQPAAAPRADHHAQPSYDAPAAKPFPSSGGWDSTARPVPGYDPFAPHAPLPPISADQRYEDHPYAAGAQAHQQPVIDNYQPELDAHHDPLHATHAGFDNENAARIDEPRMGDLPGFGATPFHAETGEGQAPDDQFYDETPPRRRKGLVTVAAVLGLAVIGTAGAFGYRNFMGGGSGLLSAPPVIRASSEPNKVAPPATQANADASKISYDRFGDRGQNEKMVSREEQPVDQREIARSSTLPRTVLPGAPVPSSNSQANSAPAANPPSALGEPKRIRTVPIRPDQADASASASGSSVVPKQQVASFPPPPAPASQPVQQVAPQPAPMEIAPQPQRAAQPAPAERAPRPQRAAGQPAPAGNAPLSLAPDANNSAPAPAAPAPAPRASAPMQVASAPSNGGTGRYHVQVASQRSEADAQAAFRSVQGKYSSVLGSQQPVIRRVELGDKGTYYRAMVGPFGTRDQAVQLCSSLKSAGGDCVVQSN